MAKGKVRLTPEQISTKWGNRIKAAIPDIVSGVEAVSESPMEKAASKQDKMRQNLLRAIDDGTWAGSLRKVPLSTWKENTASKVRERLGGGVDSSMNKRKQFDTWLVNTLNEVLPTIASMPDLTLEDSISRVRKLMEFMSNKRYKRG
ncbi:MAG: hypothetical protein QXQ02_03155 [Halobacteria archaeon]